MPFGSKQLGGSLLTNIGVFQFTDDLGTLPVPIWLVVLWIGFTCSLNYS